MMKKSLLVLILVLSFAVLSLTGCNRNNSGNSGAEPTEAELQAALEAIQQMVGGVGANAPTSTTAPASTSAPAPTTAPVNGPTNWTAVEDSTFDKSDIYSIAYGNNRFVAGGYDGEMAYSADGARWTAVANSTFGTSHITAVAWGGNRFVAVGWDGKVAYSTDGVTWTAVTDSPTWDYINEHGYVNKAEIHSIAYGNGRFVASGGIIAYSTDGTRWTAIQGLEYGISTFAYGNGRFVGPSGNGMAYCEW